MSINIFCVRANVINAEYSWLMSKKLLNCLVPCLFHVNLDQQLVLFKFLFTACRYQISPKIWNDF